MKEKFEANVAQEIPKTKLEEPLLPWKLDNDELTKLESTEEDYKSVASGTPPLKTRAVFLILLIVTMFVVTLYMVTDTIIESESMRLEAMTKEKTVAALQANLEKTKVEKSALTENSSKLEKQVSDLNAQKQLFTTVIESLTKKADDTEADTTSVNTGR